MNEINEQPNNPLHGKKLVDILEFLVEKYGFKELSYQVDINCFKKDPSIKSSLKFLRRTPWAREKVEQLYLQSI
ncbi:DUF2132 domain-containing protein [Dokdonia sinensis]|uniref:DUF2132 domain-containing protein n=1 Tax=Dokdonia sinensis TaxID=2479847 RepID=A0A3M0G5R2_9FLAO|nr:VF530 family protein [Dokdonia sinensis]RMB57602.1 DUF2132 domain-containing protein [Dokdonia sinensis]